MTSQTLISTIFAFLIGAISTYFVVSTKPAPIPMVIEEKSEIEQRREMFDVEGASLKGATPNLSANDLSSALSMLEAENQQLKMEVESLRLENDDLKQGSMGLAENVDHSNKKYKDIELSMVRLESENKRLKHELGQLAESDITDEQMKALLDEPFSNFLVGFKGQQRDEVHDFFNQPEDHEWGYDMQLHISDFITNHELQNSVNLVGVTCKISRCEIRFIEHQPEVGHFHILFQDMRRQSWWKFKSTYSTSANSNSEGGMKIFFYVSS